MMNQRTTKQALGEIMFLSGPQKGQTFQISKDHTTIGRQPDGSNDLLISEATVSRHHAEIVWDKGIWRINKLTTTSTITVDKNDMPNGGRIHNHSIIGLGPNVEILFLSYVTDNNFDPGTAPTIPGKPYTPSQSVKVPEKEPTDPLTDPGHAAWQVVGIITGITSIITIIETAIQPDSLAKIVQIVTALVVFVLCAFVVLRARRRATLSSKLIQLVGANSRKAFRNWLVINIALIVAFTTISEIELLIALSSLFTTKTAFQQEVLSVTGFSLIIFLVAMLISFIGLIIQMFRRLHQKVLKAGQIAGIAAILFAAALCLQFIFALLISKNSNTIVEIVGFGFIIIMSFVYIESLLLLVILGIRLLFMFFSRFSSSKSKLSTP